MPPTRARIRHLLPLSFTLLLGLISTESIPAVVAAAIGTTNNDDDTLIENSNDPQQDEADAESGAKYHSSHSASGNKSTSSSSSATTLADPTLSSDSVVLITGAAGFIGSELALALKRTYSLKKLLLVDNLGIDSENESSYVPPPSKKDGDNISGRGSGLHGGRAIYEKLSEEELSMFEIRRQRAFRIYHELTSAALPSSNDEDDGNGGFGGMGGGSGSPTSAATESIRFYRADMRPSIPEYFDFGEVPLLEGIFQSHPDITHVVHLADVPVSAQNQAIPRNKDSVKTGRMEGLLEEMRLMIERANADNSHDSESSTNVRSERRTVQLPQFVYASTHEVYDRISTTANDPKQQHRNQEPNPPPFREDKPITTPSSLHGTAKLIDEVLASAYHSTHGIYSVGLRFFNVYGPWNSPGTEVFDLAERISTVNDSGADNDGEGGMEDDDINMQTYDQDVNDYVYIDDAVDAILGAMQYRPPGTDPPPVVFNVGSGEGTTLRKLKDEITKHFPGAQHAASAAQGRANPTHSQRTPTTSIASTARSESLLGFKARVPLEEGLAHTLTWHRDRTFPYGRDPTVEESFEMRGMESKIIESLARSRRREVVIDDMENEGGEDGGDCSPLDRECLRGSPVFPCASECRRAERCTPSAWDDVSVLSKMVTNGCDAVLYTILLDEAVETIPSATSAVSMDALPYIGAGLPEDVGRRTQARCNIAFVSDQSPLVKRLMSEGEEYVDEESGDVGTASGNLPPLLRHGFWTVLPVSTPKLSSSSHSSSWLHAFDGTFALEYLPKLSPGQFFGSSVRYAVYAAPNVLVKNLPNLLKRMEDGPSSSSSSSTALMLASKDVSCDPAQRGSPCTTTYQRPPGNDAVQAHVYNMIRLALRGDILGGGLDPVLDSSFIIHSLREEDSRLFRCDVYGEAAQWGASSDERALEFIVSLHDLWSRAVVHWSTGSRPYWINVGCDNAEVAVEAGVNVLDNVKDDQQQHRRLLLSETSVGTGSGTGSSAEPQGSWMGILSSTEVQLFTHILPSEDLGVVHLS